MAKYVDFPAANQTLKAPAGHEKTADGTAITDLIVFSDGKQMVSCWELSPEELLEVVRTRRVYLFVLGGAHPPVCIQGNDPWASLGDFEPADEPVEDDDGALTEMPPPTGPDGAPPPLPAAA